MDRPGPCVLKELGEVRSDLLEVRRILSAMRHVASQLRRQSNSLISRELHPFLGDVHDDLAIMLDTIAGERDRLAAVLDIYFSSLANRTTEATKTLTLLGTIVLPTLVITSIFGMNVPYPGWTRSNWIFGVLLGLSLASTAALAWFLGGGTICPVALALEAGDQSTGRLLLSIRRLAAWMMRETPLGRLRMGRPPGCNNRRGSNMQTSIEFKGFEPEDGARLMVNRLIEAIERRVRHFSPAMLRIVLDVSPHQGRRASITLDLPGKTFAAANEAPSSSRRSGAPSRRSSGRSKNTKPPSAERSGGNGWRGGRNFGRVRRPPRPAPAA